ncbi:S8 family serine peptidase [Nonomuraea africana]|uniref:Subtilisin family serine protease n=1 Tax=Nonomuraea africana TaxID=46171 RepID=A0ABR9KM78_9ACTN|nr:S8 family serine peptidase [Nonomuraea africana]MBE1563117.1 subtilisin family serine protease [Nonomuraea africana]
MKQVLDGHLYVIPSDARPLVAQGVLDRRLFDVTQLLQWRYGDADTGDIPLITQSATAPALRGAREARPLAGLGMTTLRVPKTSAAQTWKELAGGARTLTAGAGTTKIWLDGRRSFSLDGSVKQIGATEAWKQGMTGEGVTVAVLDSGYDPDHPDLKDVVVQARNFSAEPDVRDLFGHGTHVASTIAGKGEKYRGVAPGARLAIGKVGGISGITDSALLAGMEWAAVEVGAKVVNMSIGGPDQAEIDPVEQAVNTLSARTGTLFVVAAGNDGGGRPVSTPASADAALAVGAVDRQDQIADFSSTGPREGDHAVKPDITAPGVEIVAAAAAGTAEGSHVARSGTSMATPHVAGAAAILAQRHPGWTGQQLKAALTGSAVPAQGATPYQQGTGRVDLVRALKQQVVAQAEGAWAAFPRDGPDGREKTATLTYTNSGDTPVTLDLTEDGEVLELGAQRLEVPAGGQASVSLAIDATGKAPGDYVGTVTATAGDTVIRTLAGAYVEPESYDVTVKAIDRNGDPAGPQTYAQFYDPRTAATREAFFQDGTARIRLPKGDWNLITDIWGRTFGTVLSHTSVKVDRAGQQVTVDARQGRQALITLDDATAAPLNVADVELSLGPWTMGFTQGSPMGVTSRFYFVPVRQEGMRASFRTFWKSKDVSPSPYLYDLVARYTDGFPDDPSYAARQKDLAKVTAAYRASGVAAKGLPLFGHRLGAEPAKFLMAPLDDVDLPGTRTYYRTPGLVWDSAFQVGDTLLVADGGRAVERGHTREVWNAAVSGPSLARPGGSRTGDKLTFPAGALFADGGAGRTGADAAATGTATLTRDGQVLAKTDLAGCWLDRPKACELRADLPGEDATYALSTSMRRQVPYSTLSTAVDATWTFRSSHTRQERPLPLMVMRYAPAGLDDLNRAKAGSRTRLPMWLEGNPGTRPQAVLVRLEMSSDDGASWHRVPVVRTASGWTAVVPNPRTAGFVSLRVKATGASGADVVQTVTRAYAVH